MTYFLIFEWLRRVDFLCHLFGWHIGSFVFVGEVEVCFFTEGCLECSFQLLFFGFYPCSVVFNVCFGISSLLDLSHFFGTPKEKPPEDSKTFPKNIRKHLFRRCRRTL